MRSLDKTLEDKHLKSTLSFSDDRVGKGAKLEKGYKRFHGI